MYLRYYRTAQLPTKAGFLHIGTVVIWGQIVLLWRALLGILGGPQHP